MRITKQKLKQIIQEELENMLNESAMAINPILRRGESAMDVQARERKEKARRKFYEKIGRIRDQAIIKIVHITNIKLGQAGKKAMGGSKEAIVREFAKSIPGNVKIKEFERKIQNKINDLIDWESIERWADQLGTKGTKP